MFCDNGLVFVDLLLRGVCLYVFCLLLLFGLGLTVRIVLGIYTQVVLRLLFWVDLSCVVLFMLVYSSHFVWLLSE